MVVTVMVWVNMVACSVFEAQMLRCWAGVGDNIIISTKSWLSGYVACLYYLMMALGSILGQGIFY